MPKQAFQKGTKIRVRGHFTDPDTGADMDPTTVTFSMKVPGGTVTTLTYGVDSALTKVSTGLYQTVVELASEGTYYFHYTASTSTAKVVIAGEVDSVSKVDF